MAAASRGATPIVNAMSVDVEDYFQVSAFDRVVDRRSWDGRESRVTSNTERMLALFDEAGVRATFFILGWVAIGFRRWCGGSPPPDMKSRRTATATASSTS